MCLLWRDNGNPAPFVVAWFNNENNAPVMSTCRHGANAPAATVLVCRMSAAQRRAVTVS